MAIQGSQEGSCQLAQDDLGALTRRNQQLEQELITSKQKIAELERSRATAVGDEINVPISEFEETLRRLVQRTAMIVQAEKCVIMVRDRETGDLVARSPAWGMNDEEVQRFRVPAESSLSGDVYLNGTAVIFQSPDADPRATAQLLKDLRVRNGVTVPLQIEKRDDQNRVVDRMTIGVLHCFNKRYGGDFIDEDVRLLERLSRNAAAVIANAQIFQEMYEEKQKLVHTLESLTAGLVLVNQRGRIGQMNAQARAMFAIQGSEEPIGKPMEQIIRHDKCQEIFKKRIAEAGQPQDELAEGEIRAPDEITITDDEQDFIYQIHSAVVRGDDDSTIGTVFIFNDITDIRNVENMKTEFVSIVSHELRTPLTPMKGFVSTLLQDENEDWYTREDRREFYTIIEDNVDRLGRLINDLLNVSRIEKMGAAGIEMNWEENVDVRKVTESVAGTQRGRTEKHQLVIDFVPEQIFVETDADKIQNILHNIINNAIKYSPDGGEVRIIGRLEPPSAEFPTGSLLMRVKDSGLGISKEDLPKIGEKFNRSSNKQARGAGGTGIGLFLTTNLVKAHHGVMWPESDGRGKGSTFSFRIPVKQPKPSPTDAPAFAAI
jgi:signal transduction histidine kinase